MAIWTKFGYTVWTPEIQNKPMSYATPVKPVVKSPIAQKPMMSYIVKPKKPSQKYSWLEESEEKELDKRLDDTWATGIERTVLQESAYKRIMEAKQAKEFLNQREKTRQKIITWEINSGNKEENEKVYKQSQFADVARSIALSQWAKNITEVDDKTIIEGMITQKADIAKTYNEFLNGKISLAVVSDKIQWKKTLSWIDKFLWGIVDAIAPWVWAIEKMKSWEAKTIWEVALDDFWAVPSVALWATTAAAKTLWGLADLWWNIILKDWWINDSIDTLTDKLWIKKDWFYDAAKIATDIGLTSIGGAGIVAELWKIKKIGELANMLTKYPKLSKYISKPVLSLVKSVWEWTMYQWLTDIQKGELSTKKDYLQSSALNVWFKALSSVMWAASKYLRPPKQDLRNMVSEVDDDVFNQMINDTKAWKNDKRSVLKVFQPAIKLIDDAMDAAKDNESVIWKRIWEYRKALDAIDLPSNVTRTSLIDDFAKSIEDFAYAKVTQWAKWWLKITNSWVRTTLAGEGTDKTLIQYAIKQIKQAQKWMKLSSIESLQRDLKSLTDESTASKWTKKAISDYITKLDTLLDVPALKEQKKLYSEAIALQDDAIRIFWKDGNKSEKVLNNLAHPINWNEAKMLLDRMKQMGVIQWDVIWHANTAAAIMWQILNPSDFQKALQTIYPSLPWAMELWLRWIKQTISPNKLSNIAKWTKWYKWKQIEQWKNVIWTARKNKKNVITTAAKQWIITRTTTDKDNK